MNSGRASQIALRTVSDNFLVAIALSCGVYLGNNFSQPSGNLPLTRLLISAASFGYSAAYFSKRAFHSFSESIPLWLIPSYNFWTSSGTSKVLDGSKPKTSLILATSSALSGEPWTFGVPWRLEPKPIVVRM